MTARDRAESTPEAGGTLNGIEDVRGYVAMTLENVNGKTWTWENDEVVGMLLDIINGLNAEAGGEAAALRRAAHDVIPDAYRDDPDGCPTVMDPWDVADWLNSRADSIEGDRS